LPDERSVRSATSILAAECLLVILAVFFAGCRNQPTENGENPTVAPRGALELVFPYGSEKEKWISDVTADFNRSGTKTQSGKTIFVRGLPMGSGETVDNILSGRLQAHIASPASAAFIKLGNAESRSALLRMPTSSSWVFRGAALNSGR
jgi:Ca-activated chloride channel family protein